MSSSTYRATHQDQIKEYGRRYYISHCEQKKEQSRLWREAHGSDIKVEVLSHYSDGSVSCTICHEKRMACLSIDHINGGGNKHREDIKIRGGSEFYRWLKKESFPPGYQVLCMNCQCIKRIENGECKKN